jgi:hypothetical protein
MMMRRRHGAVIAAAEAANGLLARLVGAVRRQFHALPAIAAMFCEPWRRESIENRPLTRLTKKLIMISAKVVGDGPYVAFQMTEVAIPSNPFADILRLIAEVGLPRFASGM